MLNEFINSFKSINLSTLDENNFPFSSYAPFIKYNNKYYVYLSDMAKHANNLKNNPKVCIFFIEDEKDCENIFARKRVTLQATSNLIKRDTKKFEKILDEFEKLNKDTVKVTREMLDFNLFELAPIYGEAIFGFGKAYNIGGEHFDTLIQRDNLRGHKSK
ncbi:heme iron utilization protein [Malaciobacter molluscorum]|uniref:HugZ family pyridoxamine 5'-phosphate oxidase n=1 Tax=Malaciobacter molluscorum TaxID=1032072 RepID=UPI00100B9269|nr:pyridoxamine 5'-phosphate oxidase family protein [Malaciobacter molluscorum]RXJ97390.1 heme iron utilization protein [Malaciobacter molluscorum]